MTMERASFSRDILRPGLIYAGLAARTTPSVVQEILTQIVARLDAEGLVLRTGDRCGGQRAMRDGARGAATRIMRLDCDAGLAAASRRTARQLLDYSHFRCHPDRLPNASFDELGRTVRIVLGVEMNDPVAFLLCWTKRRKRGRKKVRHGDTAFARTVARASGVPVFDLSDLVVLREICVALDIPMPSAEDQDVFANGVRPRFDDDLVAAPAPLWAAE